MSLSALVSLLCSHSLSAPLSICPPCAPLSLSLPLSPVCALLLVRKSSKSPPRNNNCLFLGVLVWAELQRHVLFFIAESSPGLEEVAPSSVATEVDKNSHEYISA